MASIKSDEKWSSASVRQNGSRRRRERWFWAFESLNALEPFGSTCMYSRFCAVIKIDTKRINRDDEVGTGLSGMKEEQNQNMKVTAVGCRDRRSPILSVSLRLSIKYFMFLSERGRYSEIFDCPYSEVAYIMWDIGIGFLPSYTFAAIMAEPFQQWFEGFFYMIATVCCLSLNILPDHDKWWTDAALCLSNMEMIVFRPQETEEYFRPTEYSYTGPAE